MKLLCSGNPSHKTIASAVKIQWPTADFASRATGFDLRFWTPGSEAFFRQKIINYDCFINSSFICGNGQMALLEVTVEEWVKAGIKGTIVNIGSSTEWQGTDSRYGVYGIQKRALRDRSLQLHGKQGIRTMHVTAGLLNDGAPQNRAGLDLNHVAQTIKWALEQPFCLPLLYIENT